MEANSQFSQPFPCLLAREFLYSYFEDKKIIKTINKESITKIIGIIKQFSNSSDEEFNKLFFNNIKSYAEVLDIEATKDKLVPVLVKIVDEKPKMKIHFLKSLPQFVDYLCSLGDEGINIIRYHIIQIIEEMYRDKNLFNAELKTLLFDNFIKIAKSIIPKEKDNYILDLVLSFGYESNVSMDFLTEHKKIGIKFISNLCDTFVQDIIENYLLP